MGTIPLKIDVIMTQEEKATQEAKKAEVNTEATDEESTKEVSEETKETTNEDSAQLKVQLQREREAREKAEKAAADTAFKLREARRKKEEDGDEEEKPLTPSQLQEILAKEREQTRKELLVEQSTKLIEKYTDNPTERELIAEIHKNRNFPSHLSLEEQIEESYLIANKGKILGENNELKRALQSKSNVSKGTNGTVHQSTQKNMPKIDPQDLAVYTQLGYKWDNAKNMFTKKLANGNVLARDIKTKKTFLLKD